MRRSMFAVLVIAIGFGSAFADRKKSNNAPDTAPMPAEQLAQAAHKAPATIPPPSPLYPPEPQIGGYSPLCSDCPVSQYVTTTATSVFPKQSMVVVYSVGDLVVPLPAYGANEVTPVKSETTEAQLMARIRKHVQPKSWKGAGGEGTMEYFPIGMAVVVNQSPSVQAEIEKFLEAERRLLDQQVLMEIRFVTVSEEWFEKSGVKQALLKDAVKGGETPTKVISATTLERLLKSAAECPQTNVMQAPRMTCLNGQSGRVKVGEAEMFLTGVSISVSNGQVVMVPKNEPHELGVDFTVQPSVVDDGKSIRLTVKGGLRELAVKPVPMIPVTVPLPAVKEPGKKIGDPAPFTQHMQEPTVVSRLVSKDCTVNDGSTVLMYGGKATLTESKKETAPMLRNVPAINELFVQERATTTTNHLLVLVTSKVVTPELIEAQMVKPVKHDDKVEKLMSAYMKACEQGNTDEARRLAIECLAVDPTCFSKR